MPGERALTQSWRWLWLLSIANAGDLLFTYAAAERGVEELNFVLRPILLSPWPVALKLSALGLLAASLAFVSPEGGQSQRVRRMVRSAALVYVGLLVYHTLGLTVGF